MLLKNIYFLIRYYSSKVLLVIVSKLSILIRLLSLTRIVIDTTYSDYSYYSKEHIKLGLLTYRHKNLSLENISPRCSSNEIKKWEEFMKDIKTNGILHNPVCLKKHTVNGNFDYYIDDGNHRLKALELLYGLDHIVTIDCYNHINAIKYKKQLKKLLTKMEITKNIERLEYIKSRKYKSNERRFNTYR